jgi:release factor glutamine methyltransferase
VTTLAEALAATTARLRDAGVPSPDVDARWLVEAATGSDPRHLPDRPLGPDERHALAALSARRGAREPLQLVLGTAAFRALELRCRAGVFVPRPETEVLAGLALDAVRRVRGARDGNGRPTVVHEPCCGTGAVGLAVASEVDGAVVLMADRSDAAVVLATENRDVLAAAGRLRSPVEVRHGELLDAFAGSPHGAPDVIVANPPYLPSAELAQLEPEVAGHDPHDALSGGPDGHEVVDMLLEAAARELVPGGTIVLEIDARRAAGTVAVARRVGLVEVEVHRDLTGAERFILARRPGPGSTTEHR